MALLWIDGFDSYGTVVGNGESPAGIIARKYNVSGSPAFAVQAGRVAGYSLQITTASAQIEIPTHTTDGTLVVGLAVKFAALVDSSFLVLNAGGAQQVDLRVTAAGELAVYLGGVLSAVTSGLGLQAGTWYCLALKAVCGTSGSYCVYGGPTPVLSASGVNTRGGGSAYYTQVYVKSGAATLAPTYDDFYCLDSTGSRNNDMLGVMRVVTLRPSAAGNSTQWTPDSGANYARVNEAVCDDLTSNLQASTAGLWDSYQYTDLPSSVARIAGAMVTTDWRVVGASSAGTLKTVCVSGPTERDGAGQYRETYYGWGTLSEMEESDPNNSPLAAWAPASLNAAQFGIKVG